MMFLRAAMLMAVVGLFATGDEAQAKKKNEHTFSGRIVSVQQGKKHTTITVAHHSKAKAANGQPANGQAGQTVTKTFIIGAKTQIIGGAASLQKGVRVAVLYHGHQADSIQVLPSKKKNKAAK